ncbi:MAG: hypothetical protein SV062_12460 [Thermodesulfobacteriota bacterium]|nr:hypothetical protein [Thermodesulfobacteriota bacterium]
MLTIEEAEKEYERRQQEKKKLELSSASPKAPPKQIYKPPKIHTWKEPGFAEMVAVPASRAFLSALPGGEFLDYEYWKERQKQGILHEVPFKDIGKAAFEGATWAVGGRVASVAAKKGAVALFAKKIGKRKAELIAKKISEGATETDARLVVEAAFKEMYKAGKLSKAFIQELEGLSGVTSGILGKGKNKLFKSGEYVKNMGKAFENKIDSMLKEKAFIGTEAKALGERKALPPPSQLGDPVQGYPRYIRSTEEGIRMLEEGAISEKTIIRPYPTKGAFIREEAPPEYIEVLKGKNVNIFNIEELDKAHKTMVENLKVMGKGKAAKSNIALINKEMREWKKIVRAREQRQIKIETERTKVAEKYGLIDKGDTGNIFEAEKAIGGTETTLMPPTGKTSMFGKLLVPEQVFSRAGITGRKIYEHAVAARVKWDSVEGNALHTFNEIIKPFEKNAEKIAQIRFLQENMSKLSPADLSKFDKELVGVAQQITNRVTMPFWNRAKEVFPDLKFHKDYYPHWKEHAYLRNIAKEGTLQFDSAGMRNYEKKLAELSAEHNKMATTLLDAIKRGKRGAFKFASFYKDRTDRLFQYRTDYVDVMRQYLKSGSVAGYQKEVFTDFADDMAKQWMTTNRSMYNYYNSWKDAIFGSTSFKANIGAEQFVNSHPMLKKMFGDKSQRPIDAIANVLTNFNYMMKIGTSWIRFPILNMSQMGLTTLPTVGVKTFTKGYARMFPSIWKGKNFRKEWSVAHKLGVIDVDFALAENLDELYKISKYAGIVPRISETINRGHAFGCGIEKMIKQGIPESKIYEMMDKILTTDIPTSEMIKFFKPAIDTIKRTQFFYTRESMPIITAHPFGKVMYQFKSFPAHYLNFLKQSWQNDKKAFAKSIGILGVLGGGYNIPGYERLRGEVRKHFGVDMPRGAISGFLEKTESHIPEIAKKPYSAFVETSKLITEPLAQGFSVFNMPYDPSQALLGAAQPFFDVGLAQFQSPEQAQNKLYATLKQINPSFSAALRGVITPYDITPSRRIVGEYTPAQAMRLEYSPRAVRFQAMAEMVDWQMQNNWGKFFEVKKWAEKRGVKWGKKDMTTIKSRATKKKKEELGITATPSEKYFGTSSEFGF